MRCKACKNKITANTPVAHNKWYQFDYYVCEKCHSITGYYNKNTIIKICEKMYGNTYWEYDINSKKRFINKIKWLFRKHIGTPRSRSHWKFLIKYTKNIKTMLEIGSGKGENAWFWSRKGIKITTIEPDQRCCNRLNTEKKIRAISGILEHIQLHEKFDIIYASHSVEHFVDLDNNLKKIHKALNSNGIFFMEIPNASTYKPIHLKKILKKTHDIHHFTSTGITNLLEHNGFEIITACIAQNKLEGNPSIITLLEHHIGMYLGMDSYRKSSRGDVIRVIAKRKC